MDRAKAAELVLQELQQRYETKSPVFVIHYACENFFDLKDRPASISCISIANLDAEFRGTYSIIDPWTVEPNSQPDRHVLERYFRFVKDHPGAWWIHWNMATPDYGFRAIENRYAYVFRQEPPVLVSDERAHDLDELIADRYGKNYADHPRMSSMAVLNGFHRRFFLAGKEEAAKFGQSEHGEIRRSTNEKVSLIAYLARRLLDGTLETRQLGPRVSFAGTTLDAIRTVTTLGERFWDVSRQLRRRHNSRPTLEVKDEYDAQDLLHSLLRVFFDDVRPEDPSPVMSGAPSRIDFVLPVHRLAIELKFARESMTSKSLGEELAVDAKRYQARPDIRHLVCLVFDPLGHIENPRGLERDCGEQREPLPVTVRIYDKGSVVARKGEAEKSADAKSKGPPQTAPENLSDKTPEKTSGKSDKP